MNGFTHINDRGEANMVDISSKSISSRFARAGGKIKVNKTILEELNKGGNPKGDILGTARIAGIMAAKKTPELIPLCHGLLLNKVEIIFETDEEKEEINCYCEVRLDGKTGAEMEAMTGVSVALLTIYDMCKAVDKELVISDIRLEEKDGGKSGHFVRGNT